MELDMRQSRLAWSADHKLPRMGSTSTFPSPPESESSPPSTASPSLVGSSSSGISPSQSPTPDKTDNRELRSESGDMRREEDRLGTFGTWPLDYVQPAALAKSGFYYIGPYDEVRCAFCKVEIGRWEEGDDPEKDHRRWAPQCPLLRRRPTGNVALAGAREREGQDECGLHARPRSPPSPSGDGPPAALVRTASGPAFPLYRTVAARLRSFQDWPRSMTQKPEQLADAGFYYTGQSDKTICFYCGGGLKDWEPEDKPWEQHARWFSRCAYVQLVMGREYIQQVASELSALVPPRDASSPSGNGKPDSDSSEFKPATVSPPIPIPKLCRSSDGVNLKLVEDSETSDVVKPPPSPDDAKMCKICFSAERNVCFIPCGHVVSCAKCALSTDKCPMCRRTFESTVRLYYS